MATVTPATPSEMPEALQCYSFTLVLSGVDEITEKIENALFEAGCSDALLGIHAGSPYLAFDREAKSLEDAIRTAIRDAEACDCGIEVIRVIPPGADIIDTVNAFLRMRQQLHHKLEKELPPTMTGKIDELLNGLLESDPSVLKQVFASPDD